MSNQIASKFTALSVALLVNCMMIGTVAYLFSGAVHAAPIVRVLAHGSHVLVSVAV